MPNTYTVQTSSKILVGATSPTVPTVSINQTFAPPDITFPSGSTAGSVDGAIVSSVTATTGGVSVNIQDGTLKDRLGVAIVAAHVHVLGFYNTGATAVNVTGNFITARFGASTSIPLEPGGKFEIVAPTTGLVCTASTADTITFTAASSTDVVQIVVGARSA